MNRSNMPARIMKWSVLAGLYFVATSAVAADWYVSPVGDDTAAGTRDDPFATIQHAIDVAAQEDDRVWLHSGTYTGEGNRDIELRGKAIRVGPFASLATQCIIDCQGTAEEPHISFHIHEGGQLDLNFLTIANAWTDSARQGAVYVEGRQTLPPQDGFAPPDGQGGRAFIQHAIIRATHGTAVTVLGDSSFVQTYRCKITGSSDHGVYYRSNLRFVANESTIQRSGGHGLMGRVGPDAQGMRLELSNVIDNAGSGIWYEGGSGGDIDRLYVHQCEILRNVGAGISIGGPLGVTESFITENRGGGVIGFGIRHLTWWIQMCQVRDNRGDGIRMATDSLANYNIWGSLVRGNHGNGIDLTVNGGGETGWLCTIANNKGHGVVFRLMGEDGSVSLGRSTVVENRGAGVFVAENPAGRPVEFDRLIIAFNDGAALMEGETAPGKGPARAKVMSVGAVVCTDIYGNGSDWVGSLAGLAGRGGNLDVDPEFCDDWLAYPLRPSSPCAERNSGECGRIGAADVGCSDLMEVVGQAVPGPEAQIIGAYPNPFNPQTTLVYELAKPARVDLRIYDLRGHLVRTLLTDELREPGRQEVRWSGKDDLGQTVATGVYLWQLKVPGARLTDRVTLVK